MQVTRAEIPQTTVRHAYMLDDETGYIWLTDFARGTGEEVTQAIEDLRAQGMTRLLFDLRNNGGGLLDQAIDVADHFVPEGAPIVETRGRTRDSFAEYPDSRVHDLVEMPIIVLVNSGTASAAEIVAGAIQDHDIGLIVGNPTWGKGLVQTVYNLPYGAGMALTTARYYTPTGRLIQRDYTSYYDYYRNFATPTTADEGDEAPVLEDHGDEPVFHTDLGRPVYGGGGITPDHAVDDAELSRFSQLLLSRNAHFDFAVDLAGRLSQEMGRVERDWTPSDEVLDEFEAWLVAEEIATPEQAAEGLKDPADAEDARRRVRSEVMNALYGQDESHRVRSAGDLQIQRALELFDEAEQLLARRLALDEETRVAEGLRANSSPADGER
jgi:carboxyl-terminal processing protease